LRALLAFSEQRQISMEYKEEKKAMQC